MLIKYRYLLLLALLLHSQSSVLLHELDMEHSGHVQCQLCLNANGLDLAPFAVASALPESFSLPENAQSISLFIANTAYSSAYHGRAPPQAKSFIS